jgi:hypothetical protein
MPAPSLTISAILRAILSRVHSTPAAASGSVTDVVAAYTAVARLGRQPFDLTDADRAALAAVAPAVDFGLWSHADLLRLDLLLTRAAALGDVACAEAAVACYDAGDASEQRSWLRGVSLLPSPAQYTALVIDACRTNILPVFEAVALGNPFPAEFLPDRNFNQMILKALFNGVPLARIHGLPDRRNPELARMAGDYADERRAAGRTVPADIGLAL